MFLIVWKELEPNTQLQKEEKGQKAAALQIELSTKSIIPEAREESKETLQSERADRRDQVQRRSSWPDTHGDS
jgi:hypothetical protein